VHCHTVRSTNPHALTKLCFFFFLAKQNISKWEGRLLGGTNVVMDNFFDIEKAEQHDFDFLF
jgi:hypothetical protein